MNLAINLPLLVTLSGGLALFFYGYWLRMATAVNLATIPICQNDLKEITR